MINKNLIVFSNGEFGNVRMINVDGKPYAVGIDVARVLEYANPSKAILNHCKGITKLGIPSEGGIQETNLIPEGDIFRLIVKAADQSKNFEIKQKAEKFEKWLFEEVLPSIRKHGTYMTTETIEKVLADPDTIIKIATELKEEKQKRLEAEKIIEEQKTKVEIYDQVMDSNGLLNFIQVADAFGECGRNTLMKKLRDKKILMDSDSNKNIPYSKYMKHFDVVIRPRKTDEGLKEIATTLCKPTALKLIKKVLDKEKDLQLV